MFSLVGFGLIKMRISGLYPAVRIISSSVPCDVIRRRWGIAWLKKTSSSSWNILDTEAMDWRSLSSESYPWSELNVCMSGDSWSMSLHILQTLCIPFSWGQRTRVTAKLPNTYLEKKRSHNYIHFNRAFWIRIIILKLYNWCNNEF